MTHVRGTLAVEPYRVDISAGKHTLVADEPIGRGGRESGPAPYELLLSSLAACTAITLRMYAERKGWSLERLDVDLRIVGGSEDARIHRVLRIEGPAASARLRMAEIAERTPVTLTLKAGIPIETKLAGDVDG